MYFHTQPALAARLAALDHCRQASAIAFDSAARLIELHCGAGNRMLGIARGSDVQASRLLGGLVPELFAGYLRIAGHAHEDWVRLAEAQLHNSSTLAKFTLDRTAQMAPPMVELALDAAESLIDTGESAADEIGDATIKAVEKVGRKIDRSLTGKTEGRKGRIRPPRPAP